MKLNPDCVRDVLLALESILEVNDDGILDQNITFFHLRQCKMLESYSDAEILYTIEKLCQGGFINPVTDDSEDGFSFTFYGTHGITYQGHEFLGTIRPQKIWDEIKLILKKNGYIYIIPYLGCGPNCAKATSDWVNCEIPMRWASM